MNVREERPSVKLLGRIGVALVVRREHPSSCVKNCRTSEETPNREADRTCESAPVSDRTNGKTVVSLIARHTLFVQLVTATQQKLPLTAQSSHDSGVQDARQARPF